MYILTENTAELFDSIYQIKLFNNMCDADVLSIVLLWVTVSELCP